MSEATDIRADILAEVLLAGRTGALSTYANSYDPTTGLNTATATTRTIPITPPYQKRRFTQQGGDAQARATSFVTVPAEDLELVPEPGARLVIGPITWTIVTVQAFEYQDIVVAYECALAQGGAT